jgi:hypothetical protein
MNCMPRQATTREDRARHVAQMRANFALEGMLPRADDIELQQCYIEGEISVDEMLHFAQDFARNSAAR